MRGSHFVIYALYRCGAALISLLSMETAFRLGAFLGSCAYWMLPRARRIARDNLRAAFPEMSRRAIRNLTHQNFAQLGANLVSALKMTSMSWDELAPRFSFDVPEEVTQRRATGRGGWIAMLSHLGNWEAFAHLGHLLP